MSIPTVESIDDLRGLMPYRTRLHDRGIEFVQPPPDLDFARPFWHMTVEDLAKADKQDALEKVVVSFEQLRSLIGPTQPDPAGMIFHIGRCGSTLVSRMVGHDPTRLVLRETSVIGGLHRATGGSDAVPTFTIEQAFKDVLVAFELFAASRNQRVIVKHSSWESFSMGRVAELLPEARFVFVYRNPIETVESSLDGHPGWGGRLHEPHARLGRWIPWIERLSPPHSAAEIYAAVWASGADAALRLSPDRVILVDHRELTAEPERTLARLCAHLDLGLSPPDALAELGHYAKAKTDGVEFDPSGSHAHPKLAPRTRDRVLEIVEDLPERLEARLQEQAALEDAPPTNWKQS